MPHQKVSHCIIGDDRNVEEAVEFIKQKFMQRNLNKSKVIYTHLTTATDTSNIKVIDCQCTYLQVTVVILCPSVGLIIMILAIS